MIYTLSCVLGFVNTIQAYLVNMKHMNKIDGILKDQEMSFGQITNQDIN